MALRYAAGYMLLSLKRRFSSIDPSLSTWIGKQTDSDFSGGSYAQFTKIWVEKINRGGMFKISHDSVYEVFLTLQLVLRQFLKGMYSEHGLDRSKVTEILFEDNEVQFHWSMMTFDIAEKSSQMVLSEVQVTIRGFRYASCIVEEYKRSCGALKRQKSLRNELKKQISDTCEQILTYLFYTNTMILVNPYSRRYVTLPINNFSFTFFKWCVVHRNWASFGLLHSPAIPSEGLQCSRSLYSK